MKRFISSLCALSILFACTQEEPAPIRVESIELDSEELELIEGNSISLVATILPKDAENQNVIWSSSNKAVASVKDGEVTAVSVGEATITAKSEDGGKKATCKVVVSAKHIPVSSVILDKEEVSLIIEDKVTLTATVTPDNASDKTIVWTSSDEFIATVKDGEVTALKVGEAVITATSEDGGKKATCKVTVNPKPVPVTGVSLNKQKARVFINDELTLTATVAPEDATNKTLVWTTSNALVATVKNGVVKGISVGEADITVKTEDGNHSATCKVSVTEESQTQTKGPMTLDLGTVTSTTATFNGFLDVDMLGEYDMNAGGVGFIYAPADQPLNIVTSSKVQISEVDSQGKFTHTLTGLKYNSEYHYAIFVYKNTICQYGETQVFETVPIDIELSVKDITQTRATFTGNLKLPSKDKLLEIGLLYSEASEFIITTSGISKVVLTDLMATDGKFTYQAKSLSFDRSHYYRYYVKQGDTYFYSDILNFKTEEVSINLSVSGTTQLTATFTGKVELTETGVIEVGVLYSTEGDLIVGESGVIKKKITPDSSGNISFKLDGLQYAVTYHYCYYLYHNGQYTYGTTQTFTTSPVSINLSVGSITQTTAQFSGKVGQLTEDNTINVGVLYTTGTDLDVTNSNVTKRVITPDESGNLSFKATNLHYDKTYQFCYYTYQNGQYTCGPTQTFKTAPVEFNTSISVSMTSVTVKGTVDLTEKEAIEVGVIYYQGPIYRTHDSALGDRKLVPDSKGKISSTITGLRNNESYYLRFYTYQNGVYRYDEPRSFRTSFGELLGVDVTQTTATFYGKINRTNEEAERFSVGIKYSTDSDLTKEDVLNEYFSKYGDYPSCTVKGLQHGTTYYYCYFVHDKEKDKITYGNTQTLTTTPVDNINLSVDSVTQTTATFSGNVGLNEDGVIKVGVLYSIGSNLTYGASGVMKQVLTPDDSGAVSFKAEGLQHGTSYNYCYYIYQNGKYTYGPSQSFRTQSVTMTLSVDSVTQTTAVFNGNVELTEDGVIEVGVLYSTGNSLANGASGVIKQVLAPDDSGAVTFKAEGLQHGTAYNYCYYICQNGKYTYGASQNFTTASPSMTLNVDSLTQTTVTFGGNVELTEDGVIEVGVLYSTGNNLKRQVLTPDDSGAVSFKYEGLQHGTTYNYRYYIYQNGKYTYGASQNFTTMSPNVTLNLDSVTQTTATFGGNVGLTEDGVIEVGVLYSTGNNLTNGGSEVMKQVLTPDDSGAVSFKSEGLQHGTTYNYCYYIYQNEKYTYGASQNFTTASPSMTLNVDSLTQTTATFGGNVELTEDGVIEVGVLYSIGSNLTNGGSGVTKQILTPDGSGAVSFKAEGLQHGTAYNYRYYICQNGKYKYGTSQNFTTMSPNVTLTVESVTQTTATFGGNVELTEDGVIEVGVLYSIGSNLTNGGSGVTKQILTPDGSGNISFKAEGLLYDTAYYCCYYVCQNEKYTYGSSLTFTTTLDMEGALCLTDGGAANCYIVPKSGMYKIEAVKGNSSVSVGLVTSAEVLWESFGTSTITSVGQLISKATYKDGYIAFQIPDAYMNGNAVVAAKDANGTILWSWHIWLTDQPQEHVYNNNAGTMMDRNLGATSATKGDIGALGLLYQWGRKDPFLGSSSISKSTEAKSTIIWPSAVESNASTGTIEYATANPTSFITENNINHDWYYTGSSLTDDTRWSESDRPKSIYDPCPAGWRVPDGGSKGVWSKAIGSSSSFKITYDDTNEGMNFSDRLGCADAIWYPISGCRYYDDGSLNSVSYYGFYWSASPSSSNASSLYLQYDGLVSPSSSNKRAYGLSVRCLKE